MKTSRKPYKRGKLRKQRCVCCGAKASEQFSISMCADTSKHKGGFAALCKECDYLLNRIVMTFFYGNSRKVMKMLKKYRKRQDA